MLTKALSAVQGSKGISINNQQSTIINQQSSINNSRATSIPRGTLSGYAIDSATVMLTSLADSPFPIRAGAITSDTFGDFLFVSGTGGMTSFNVDVTSGALTQVGSPVPYAGATALTYVP